MTTLVDQGLPPSVVDAFTIIGSLATAAGVIVALVVAFRTDARQRAIDERTQAALVYGFVQHQRTARGATTASVRVVNASATPIYDVVVGAGARFRDGPRFFNGAENNWVVPAIPPGEHAISDEGKQYTEPKPPFTAVGGPKVTVALTFRDAAGQWWQRDAAGKLETIPDGLAARDIPVTYEPQEIRRTTTTA